MAPLTLLLPVIRTTVVLIAYSIHQRHSSSIRVVVTLGITHCVLSMHLKDFVAGLKRSPFSTLRYADYHTPEETTYTENVYETAAFYVTVTATSCVGGLLTTWGIVGISSAQTALLVGLTSVGAASVVFYIGTKFRVCEQIGWIAGSLATAVSGIVLILIGIYGLSTGAVALATATGIYHPDPNPPTVSLPPPGPPPNINPAPPISNQTSIHNHVTCSVLLAGLFVPLTNNGVCEDGGNFSHSALCARGTDFPDCPVRFETGGIWE